MKNDTFGFVVELEGVEGVAAVFELLAVELVGNFRIEAGVGFILLTLTVVSKSGISSSRPFVAYLFDSKSS